MSNLSDFVGKKFSNRIFFAGPASKTWNVPSSTREIEVHVWGGGGCCAISLPTTNFAEGGGGGGYATARLNVSGGEQVSITVGASQGTSTVTLPGQSPNSPISATGGTCCVPGTGSITLAPPHPTNWCYVASGGSGRRQSLTCNCSGIGGIGGSSAGSPYGTGKQGGFGGCSQTGCVDCYVGGGGGGSAVAPGNNASLGVSKITTGGSDFYNPNWFSMYSDAFAGKGADWGIEGTGAGFLGGASGGGWSVTALSSPTGVSHVTSQIDGRPASFGGGAGVGNYSCACGGLSGTGLVLIYY